MKRLDIAYWIATGIIALVMTAGGVIDLSKSEDALEILTRLGYPEYLARILGVAKLLGVIALLAPVPRWTREWAYAGFVIDLGGAALSHLAVGDPIGDTLMPAGLLVPVFASHILWHMRLGRFS